MTGREHYDVVIVGGAVIGSSVAYFLACNPDFDGKILVVERDWSYEKSSTALSVSSIRHQFSSPLNVQISKFGTEFLHKFAQTTAVAGDSFNPGFVENGYLFLATEAQRRILEKNHVAQISCDVDVVLLSPEELKSMFPHLNVDDLALASYSHAGEGWFDSFGFMQGLRKKAQSLDVEYIEDEVTGLVKTNSRVTRVELKTRVTASCDNVVNAAGPRASSLAAMAGLAIPVEPRKRSVFVFDCETHPAGKLPLMINTDGVYVRPEGRCFVAGCPPVEDPVVDYDDFEVRHHEFEDIIWPSLAARSANFEAIKLTNYWAGHYAYNKFDYNAIVGPHPEVSNFYFANGFTGHGLQQSPAVGRGISELITYGEFRELDLSPLGYARIQSGTPYIEQAVI